MILVTGGTGFVGPKIVHALRAAGHDVRVLARKPGSKAARRAQSWGCEVVAGDMTDAASLRRAVEGCGTLVHLVAIPLGSPERFERVMGRGTRDLLTAAKEAGVGRVVLMSANGTGEETRELTSYFRQKWNMEQAVRESGLPYVIFRPSYIFGPDGGVLDGAIKGVRFSPVVPMVVPHLKMQPIWVEDVAAFFAKAVEVEAATGRTFALAGPDIVTWAELWQQIERVLGKRRANVRIPLGALEAVAKVGDLLPPTRGASEGVRMLAFGDNVADATPAVETFGIRPIGLTEQIRRAA